MQVHKPKHLAGLVILLLSLGVPVSAFIGYQVFSPRFLPSSALNWVSTSIGPLLAIVYFSRILARDRKKIFHGWALRDSPEALRPLALLVGVPAFVLFIWHAFSIAPLPYVAHLLASPSPESARVIVTHTTYGRRGCHPMAKLQGDTFWFPQVVCGLSQEDAETLKSGGVLSLRGDRSLFGFKYRSYSIDSGAR